MHLARARALLRPRSLTSPVSNQSRFVSGGHHTHEKHTDGAEYSPEGGLAGFSTPFWRNTLLASLLVVSFYKWAPQQGDDAYLTRWIAYYSTPSDTWAQLNEKHLLQSQQVTDNTTVHARATRPGILRYRYPQSLEQASPHLQPVGSVPDMSGVVARTD